MDKAMSTERGGEQTQYEGVDTFARPHDKQAGQLGSGENQTQTPKSASALQSTDLTGSYDDEAEKIRFGQTVSENGGVSGFTDPKMNAGEADGADRTSSETTEDSRAAQGYGGKNETSDEVGA